MGFLDRLLGRPERDKQPGQQRGWNQQPQGYQYGQQSYQVPQQQQQSAPGGWGQAPQAGPQGGPPRSEDEQAVERYRYLLRTAPPERIEQVHAEAFERLTPEQRRMVYEEFTRTAPDGEAPRGDDARSLAQAATRSEIRQPGFMERSLGGMNRGPGGGMFGGQRSGPGFGSMLGASILGTVAGYVIGSTLMSAFLPDAGAFDGGTDASGDNGDGGDNGGDGGDQGGDAGGDQGGYDGGGDFGGGDAQAADWGGGFDQGGFGDFGGGDFDI